ncbi:hypothetical protein BRC81_14245 [Halobacteriales archaeon QS_1_68_20]|nr:MAG: hypothetical protein BRC81_14245 [Halobacteriales archaeon QS_1_68_20]
MGVVLVVVTSGCLGAFGGVSQERLCEEADYDWNKTANATYRVSDDNTYQAVYEVNNTSSMELHTRDGLGNDDPLEISSVKFRAEDGTVYDCEDIDVETTRHETIVEFPEENGQFAYTAESPPKRFGTQRFVDGSHEVILPPDREISNPIFGSVQPSGYDVSRPGDQVHIRWDDADGRRISVQYYLKRDIPLFFGIVTVAGIAALAGIAYYYRLVRGLERRREEAGLDVDVDDDDRRDPPPGMG